MAFYPDIEAVLTGLPPKQSRDPRSTFPRLVREGHIEEMKRHPGEYHRVGVIDNPMEWPPTRDMRAWFRKHDPEWMITFRTRASEEGGKIVYAMMLRVGDCPNCQGEGSFYDEKGESYACSLCDGLGRSKGENT